MSNHLKATNLPTIRGPLPSGSRLPCPGGPPPSRGQARLQSACHLSTNIRGPIARRLTDPRARGRATAPARRPRRPPQLAVVGHHPPPGQLRPAALIHLSGGRQARRPTVARRWAARTRPPAPTPAPSPHRGHPRPWQPGCPHAAPPRICPRPRPQQLSFLTPRNWKFMSSALQPSVR